MKYTFINAEGTQQTVNIPDEVFKQGKRERLSNSQIIERFLSDEGYMVNDIVKELNAKAKANGTKASADSKPRKAPVRKPDEVKRAMIAALADFLKGQDHVENLDVTNVERMIAFSMGDDNFELVLQKKRKPKA